MTGYARNLEWVMAFSVIFNSQVSLRVHYCIRDEEYFTNGLISRMLFSELHKIMVNKVTFISFRGDDRRNRPLWICPCTTLHKIERLKITWEQNWSAQNNCNERREFIQNRVDSKLTVNYLSGWDFTLTRWIGDSYLTQISNSWLLLIYANFT